MAFLRKYVFLDLYWRVSIKQNFSLIAGPIWKSGPSLYLVDQVFQQKAQTVEFKTNLLYKYWVLV